MDSSRDSDTAGTADPSLDGTEILVPRRRPAQQRSRERFNRILTAARSVLVDLGFESFTFDEVAKRAEVPIGTLYQFFANKYVLI
ncbi:MAG: helix-turn-helix transcriptional regulator, partial [Corynebacterium sp.]|nr:helix-turn-helix transcriptional regulator [Corynebacterium sp.]